MRALGTLGAIAALLAAYLLVFDRDQQRATAARLLPAVDRAAVRRVTIARAGEAPFALVRAGDDWRIAPGDGAADRAAVEDLLNALDQAESERTADVAPDSAGLSPPRVTVSLDDGRGSAELRLGKADATGRGVFVQRRPADAVVVGPRRILQLADRPPDAWRDRRLLPFSPDVVTHVGWRRSPDDREHGWDRIGDGWRNTAGERLAADRVAAVLRRIADLRATATRADAGARGEGWIALRGPSGAEVQLTSAQLPAGGPDDLWPALEAADAADRRLLSIPPERVRRVDLEEGARQLHLARDGAAQPWRFDVLDARFDIDQEWVAEFLTRLASTTITASANEGRRLIVDGRTEDAVTVGRSDPAFALLDPDPLRFRSRKVLDFAHFDVRELQRTGAGVSFDLRSVDGETWSRVIPGAPLDGATVSRIVGTLGNLRAARFVASAPAGPASFVLHVQVQPPGSHAPVWHRVDLWDACLGRADYKTVFQLPRDECNELRLDPAPKR